MPQGLRTLMVAGAMLLIPIASAAAFGPDEPLPDPVLETRARSIGKELRCVVCQNQSIGESDAELARAMRGLVRERLLAGDSDADVIAAMQDRYGDFIRLMPPLTWGTVLLWATPGVFLGLGLVVWWRAFRRKSVAVEAIVHADDAEAVRPAFGVYLTTMATALVVAGGVYAALGHPALPDQPIRPRLAERLGVTVAAVADMETMVQQLEQRLDAVPTDATAWTMLGRANRYLDRQAEAAAALERAVALGAVDGRIWADLGESRVLRDGRLTPASREAFARALIAQPDEPRAAFFVGMAAVEDGLPDLALRIWLDAAARQEPGSLWQRRLEGHVARLTDEMKRPKTPPTP